MKPQGLEEWPPRGLGSSGCLPPRPGAPDSPPPLGRAAGVGTSPHQAGSSGSRCFPGCPVMLP